jgi:hypothetical protein
MAAIWPAPMAAMGAAPPPLPAHLPSYASTATYSSGYRPASTRPGILIAVAVISILLGCLSMLVSGLTANMWRGAAAASTPPRAVMLSPLPAAEFPPYTGAVIPAGGFSAPLRAKIISALQNKTPLSLQQSQMLDRMLAEDGADILPTRNADDLEAQAQLRSPNDADAIQFKTPQSIIALTSSSCTYGPANEPGWIRVQGNIVERYTAKDGVVRNWNSASIESALDRIRSAATGVSNMQLGFVLNEIQNPENHLQPDALHPNSELNCNASMRAGNILNVAINGEDFQVLPDGRGIKVDTEHPGLDAVTGRPLPPPAYSFHPFISGDPHLMYARYVYCMAVIALAMYLILAAIVTLIRPRLWAWMHLPFAGLKLIAIVVEIYISLAFIASAANPSNATRQYNSDGETIWLAISCTLQSIYPLALILLYLLNPRLRRMPRT